MKRLLHRRFPRRAVLIGAAATLSALAVATVAQAQLAQPQGSPDETLIIRAGQTVSIDPQTGRLRQPTSSEARALAQQMLGQYQRTAAAITVHQSASGMLRADLPEEYQDVLVLRLLPDGTTKIECVHGPDAASDLVLRGDLPKAEAATSEALIAKAPIPTASIAKAPTAPRAVAAPARSKSVRKSAKPASVSTVRR